MVDLSVGGYGSDMSDPQDRAEALDSDKLAVDDLQDMEDIEPNYPLDQLVGADEYGITAAEERFDEPLDERVERESADPLVAELERERDEAASDGDGGEDQVGRIFEPGTDDDVTEFIDREGDSVGGAVPADDLSAEEAAMHPTDDPPMGRPGGGYLD